MMERMGGKMKNNMPAFIAAALAVLFCMGFICVMSVKVGGQEGYSGMPLTFSFGGKAKLRNTIEIPLQRADKLKLEYGSKNIKVYPGGDDVITVKEYLYSKKGLAEVVYGSDGEVVIRGGRSRNFILFGFWAGEGERIEVYVPERSLAEFSIETKSGNITSETDCTREDGTFSAQAGSGNIRLCGAGAKEFLLEAGSGNIRAEALSGENISINAGSGNVHAEEITGSLTMETGSGNIDGKELRGGVNADSGSGNIKIDGLTGSVKAEVGSGNVTVKAKEVSGGVSLSAGSGNVRLEMPEETEFHFIGDTRSGNISTDFDDALSYDKKGKSARGDVGQNPDIEIWAETGSGSINIVYR